MIKSQGIKVNKFVDVKARFLADGVSLDRLNTLLMVNYNTTLPQPQFFTYNSADEVMKDYGIDLTYQFAKDFFGVTSKNLTKPKQLTLYVYSKTDTAAAIKGGQVKSLTELKKLNGKFKISIDGSEKEVSVNLTGGGVNSYSDAATTIQTAIRSAAGGVSGFSNAVCSYSPITDGFIVQSGTKGKGSSIAFPTSPGSDTDLSTSLGLSEMEGARIIDPITGSKSFDGALKELEKYNGNYYVITTLFDLSTDDDNDELLAAADWVDSSNDDYLFIYKWNNVKLIQKGTGVIDKYKAYNGLYIDFACYETQNAISAGLISAMDLTKEGGNYNLNFNEFAKLSNFAIKEDFEFEALQQNLSNCLYTVNVKGQTLTMYGEGYILGTKTKIANVYLTNSWIKFQQQIAGLNLFANSPIVSLRGDESEAGGKVISAINEVFNNAVTANLIRPFKLLEDEKNKVIDAFGEAGKTCIDQLERFGYFVKIDGFDLDSNAIIIKDAYLPNSPGNKLIINTYVVGV